MLVTAPHLIGRPAIVLASRGCVAEAVRLTRLGQENGFIDQASASSLRQNVAGFIFVSSLHVEPVSGRCHAREAFRQAMRRVGIETSSRWNQRCPYRPNCGRKPPPCRNRSGFGLEEAGAAPRPNFVQAQLTARPAPAHRCKLVTAK